MIKNFALALALMVPVSVHAQDFDGMEAGLTMLETNVAGILEENGLGDVDPRSLSLAQIVEIITVVREGDDNSTRQAIEVVLGN